MTTDNTPPHRLTTPEEFPDLDAALAASVIARKVSAPHRTAEQQAPEAYEPEPLIDVDERSQPHPAAFAGAALGLVLIGLLVFSVVRVSDDSIRPPAPMMNVPTSLGAPTPVAASAPPAAPPAVTPPTPDGPAPQLEAAPPPAPLPPPPPASPPVPSALFTASNLTAQTMIVKPSPQPEPQPEPEPAPEDGLRALLHERFPDLFPDP